MQEADDKEGQYSTREAKHRRQCKWITPYFQKKAFSEAWLAFFRMQLPEDVFRKVDSLSNTTQKNESTSLWPARPRHPRNLRLFSRWRVHNATRFCPVMKVANIVDRPGYWVPA